MTFAIIGGMSTTIAVSSSFEDAPGTGYFLRVQSIHEPSQAWSKWFPSKEIAAIEGESLGLTERGPDIPNGLTLIIQRRFKGEAEIDPAELLRYNFAPVAPASRKG